MKRLLLILILTLTFQSWTIADEITEFEIEGMSVGESALKYYNINELKKNIKDGYTSNKYFTTAILGKYEEYDRIELSFYTGDSNYIIQDVTAVRDMDYSNCVNQLDQIEKEISSLYGNSSKIKNDGKLTYSHPVDKSGETKITDIAWFFQNGDVIVVQCYNWQSEYGKSKNFKDMLTMSVSRKDIDTWLSSEAYK